MLQKRIPIAVVTTDSYFSYSILKDVLTDPRIDCRCMYILPGSGAGSPLATLRKVYQRSGPRLVGYKVATAAVAGARNGLGRVGVVKDPGTPSALARRSQVPVRHARDCNGDAVIGHLAGLDIDQLLSVNVYQRMREPLLSTPTTGSLNTHFGLLPHYRGMSPVLWAMANGEPSIGLTVHRMVLAFDEGQIVRQSVLDLLPRESLLSAMVRGCAIARGLLVEAVLEFAADPSAGVPQLGEGTYFSLPTRAAVHGLRQQGRVLTRFSDLGLLLR